MPPENGLIQAGGVQPKLHAPAVLLLDPRKPFRRFWQA